MAESLAPIALFVYNRPLHTWRTIEALKNNKLAGRSDLYIFSDGAKDKSSRSAVDEVRELVADVQGFSNVSVIERETNYGLARSIIDGVSRLCQEFGQVIVLEDDLETSPYFLSYMRDALELYKHDEAVISIHGYTYPTDDNLPETFFLRGADCWGWATWKRGWDLFESDGKKLLEQLEANGQTSDFNFGGSYDYMSMLRAQVAGKNSSWAVRWYASAYLSSKLTLYPGRSLVANIGNDNTGTHCKDTDVFSGSISSKAVSVTRIAIEENIKCRLSFERYFRTIKAPFISRLASKLRSVVISCL